MRARLQSLQKQFDEQHARASPWKGGRGGGAPQRKKGDAGADEAMTASVELALSSGLPDPAWETTGQKPTDSTTPYSSAPPVMPVVGADASGNQAEGFVGFGASAVLQENPMFNCTPGSSMGLSNFLNRQPTDDVGGQPSVVGGGGGRHGGGGGPPAYKNAAYGGDGEAMTPELSPLPVGFRVAAVAGAVAEAVAADSPIGSEITMAGGMAQEEGATAAPAAAPAAAAAIAVAAPTVVRSLLPPHSPPVRDSPSSVTLQKKMKMTLPGFRCE